MSRKVSKLTDIVSYVLTPIKEDAKVIAENIYSKRVSKKPEYVSNANWKRFWSTMKSWGFRHPNNVDKNFPPHNLKMPESANKKFSSLINKGRNYFVEGNIKISFEIFKNKPKSMEGAVFNWNLPSMLHFPDSDYANQDRINDKIKLYEEEVNKLKGSVYYTKDQLLEMKKHLNTQYWIDGTKLPFRIRKERYKEAMSKPIESKPTCWAIGPDGKIKDFNYHVIRLDRKVALSEFERVKNGKSRPEHLISNVRRVCQRFVNTQDKKHSQVDLERVWPVVVQCFLIGKPVSINTGWGGIKPKDCGFVRKTWLTLLLSIAKATYFPLRCCKGGVDLTSKLDLNIDDKSLILMNCYKRALEGVRHCKKYSKILEGLLTNHSDIMSEKMKEEINDDKLEADMIASFLEDNFIKNLL